MTAPLFSDQWYRVAALQPRWALHLRVDRQVVRGETWQVLTGGTGSGRLRVDASAWALLGRCDGATSLQQAWDAAMQADPDGMPTQDEAIELLSAAIGQGFLVCDRWPDLGATLDAQDDARRRERWQRASPLSMRIRLCDPTPLLRALEPLGRAVYSPAGAIAWTVLVVLGLLAAIGDWDAIARHGARWLESPRYWLLAGLCWVPMKAVHELAHGLAVRRFGGRVREAGLGLMMFFPAPYVDAGDAARFPDPRARALVGAAGILAELALAAAALLLWLRLDEGWARDAAFAVAAIGGASTLLFNANPLVRMDGYHVLTDLAQLPNLAVRSGATWRALVARHLLGLHAARAPDPAPRERPWLLAHAPLAWGWQASIGAWLVMWAGGHHRLLGAAAAVATFGWLLGAPIARLMKQATGACRDLRDQARLRTRAALALALPLLGLVAVPVPDRSVAQGLVWLPDEAQVRARADGFVQAVATAPGASVAADAALIRLDDPALRAERDRLRQRAPGLRAELYASLRDDPAKSRQAQERLASLDAELRRLDERIAQLEVRAPAAGRFDLALPQDLPGRHVKEGQSLGLLLGDARPQVRVALTQDDAARLRDGVRAVSVSLAEAPLQVLPATLLRDAPAAAERLPGAALGDRHGGDIVVDPTDRDGLKPARPTWLIDVALAADAPPLQAPARVGARALVRFDHGASPLAWQALRSLSQTVQVRFATETW